MHRTCRDCTQLQNKINIRVLYRAHNYIGSYEYVFKDHLVPTFAAVDKMKKSASSTTFMNNLSRKEIKQLNNGKIKQNKTIK